LWHSLLIHTQHKGYHITDNNTVEVHLVEKNISTKALMSLIALDEAKAVLIIKPSNNPNMYWAVFTQQ